jgi:hypothetical protein
VPLENLWVEILSAENECVLRHNYEIGSSVRLHFQDPASRTIRCWDVTLFEKMFMAGLRLSFPKIA